MRSYNTRLAERCAQAPRRLKFAALLPLRNPPEAVAEVRRAKELGAVAISRRIPNAASGECRECDTQSASRRARRPRARTRIDLWTSSRETISAEAGSPVVQAASLGGLFFLAALPSCFLWLAFGAAVQQVFHSRRRLRIFNVVMGALLALSIALIVR